MGYRPSPSPKAVLCCARHEICQKFCTTGFLGQKFYTLETCKLWLFLLAIKQHKFQYNDLGLFFVEIQMNMQEFNSFGEQVSVSLPNKWVNFKFIHKFCKETCCFMEKFTQLENFLQDRWSRQISSLSAQVFSSIGTCWNTDIG